MLKHLSLAQLTAIMAGALHHHALAAMQHDPAKATGTAGRTSSQAATHSAGEPAEFWFAMGSACTYLTVMQLAEVERRTGVTFRWRLFDPEGVHDDVPAPQDGDQASVLYGTPSPSHLPPANPPDDPLLFSRIALLGFREGWGMAFVRAAYRRWYRRTEDCGPYQDLVASLRDVGQAPARVLMAANAPAIAAELQEETRIACARGVFGSPSFVVCGRLFWGGDRLQEAVAHCLQEPRCALPMPAAA